MRRSSTYLRYESLVRVHLKPGIGARRLTQLNVANLQAFFNGQLDAGHSARSVQLQCLALSGALRRAQREGLLATNPARLVELPASHPSERPLWSATQVSQFLGSVAEHRLYPAFLILALYGLRSGELVGLQWADIDLELGVIHIRQQLRRVGSLEVSHVKTAAGRRDLPLLESVRSQLEARQAGSPSGFVFVTKRGTPIEPASLARSFEQLQANQGLPRTTLHSFRHSVATMLKNAHVPARDAQLILGHADVHTTQQIYQHADLAGQHDGLKRVESVVLGQPDGLRSRQMLPSRRQSLQHSEPPWV